MMVRTLFLVCTFVCGISVNAQSQDPLAGLSGKAKAKKLKQEEREAKKDKEYLAIMYDAHELFAQNKFEEALSLYEQAHKKRPINQYPKVKIEDVKLALENYVEPQEPEIEAKIEEQISIEEKPEEKSQEERVEEAYEKELDKAKKVVDQEVKLPKTETPKEVKPVNTEKLERISISELREELAREYEDGVYENTFMEGKKSITERIVVKDGKGDLYRKVVHPWGGVYYFKNYASASEYTWKQSFK